MADQTAAVPAVLLRHLLETVTLLDRDGLVLFSSGDPGPDGWSLAGRRAVDLVHPDELAQYEERWQWVLAHPGEATRNELRVDTADGWKIVEGMAVNLLHDPNVGAILVASRNVTERVEELERIDALRERYEALVQQAADLVVLLHGDGEVAYTSPAVHRFLPDDAATTRSADELLAAVVHPEDRSGFDRRMRAAAERPGEPVAVSWRAPHVDGTVRHIEGVITDLRAVPAVAGFVVNGRDVTDQRAFEDKLVHRSLHDVLTGLPNRTLLLDRITSALERGVRTGHGVAVLFCDLDRFKSINDSLGHGTGDLVLQEVARRVTSVVRGGDTVARFGGDELVVVCQDLETPDPAIAVGERIVAALRPPVSTGRYDLHVTTSVGIAFADGGTGTAEALLRDADLAMYHAKERGKDRVAVFDASLHHDALARVALDQALRRAVPAGELALWLQPVVHLASGRVRALEALVRWQDPERGVVPPGEFLAVAEETGVIDDIDRWVVAAACRAGARLASLDGPARRVWCNLSPRTLRRPDVAPWLLGEAAAAGLDPTGLGVEITESVLLEHAVEAGEALGELRAHGVKVALDDFGTGYSSLAYLRRVPVDVLKVDRFFVHDLTERSGAAVVRAVVAMAEALGLDCVAEGVDERQLATLRMLGCPAAQGYLLGRPRPADEVVEGARGIDAAPHPHRGGPARSARRVAPPVVPPVSAAAPVGSPGDVADFDVAALREQVQAATLDDLTLDASRRAVCSRIDEWAAGGGAPGTVVDIRTELGRTSPDDVEELKAQLTLLDRTLAELPA